MAWLVSWEAMPSITTFLSYIFLGSIFGKFCFYKFKSDFNLYSNGMHASQHKSTKGAVRLTRLTPLVECALYTSKTVGMLLYIECFANSDCNLFLTFANCTEIAWSFCVIIFLIGIWNQIPCFFSFIWLICLPEEKRENIVII